MSKQKAICVKEHLGITADYFTDLPMPSLKPREVRVKVEAVGLNHMDLWVRKGIPGFKFPLPLVPGCDMLGHVIECDDSCQKLKVGDRVVVSAGYGCGYCSFCMAGDIAFCKDFGLLGEFADGTQRETVCLDEKFFFKVDESLPVEQAATIGVAQLTAYEMFFKKAQAKPGDKILVCGASAGVGFAATAFADYIGAEIFCLVSKADKRKRMKELYPRAEMIDSSDPDWFKAVKAKAGNQAIDIVLDSIGGDFFRNSLSLLRPGGKLVTCGATLGPQVDLPLNRVFFKSLQIIGSTMGNLSDFEDMLRLYESSKVKQEVSLVDSWKNLPRVLKSLESRELIGKACVLID